MERWIHLASGRLASLVAVPILVGTCYAVHDAFPLRWMALLLALVGGVAAYLGAMMAVALLEAVLGGRQGADDDETAWPRGADVLAAGSVTVRRAALGAALALVAGLACGLALVPEAGSTIFALGIAAVVAAIWYGVPEVGLRDLGHGLAELTAFLLLGPVPVLAGYAAQTGRLAPRCLLVSLPLAFLGATIVHGRHLARLDADIERGGASLALDLGEPRARQGCWVLVLLAYGSVALAFVTGEIPAAGLAALVTLPLAVWRLSRLAPGAPAAAYDDLARTAATLHAATGALLAVGFALEAWLAR